MRQADAEIEADFMISHDEIVAARDRDRAALGHRGPSASQRAYREANKEKIAAYQRAYREAARRRKESAHVDT